MSTEQLLFELKKCNIEIWIEEDKLKFKAPKGVLTSALKEQMSEHKAELIDLIKNGQVYNKQLLSFNQQSIWFLHSLYPESPAYNVGLSFRVLAEIDTVALQKAFDRVIMQNEVLRTTYHLNSGTPDPVQIINSFSQIKIGFTDVSDKTEDEIQKAVSGTYNKTFDLENGPVIRFNVFSISGTESVFLITVHHIACDAFSLKILLKSLLRFYKAPEDENTDLQSGEHISYAAYVSEQYKLLADKNRHAKLVNFWKKRLDSHPGTINLPRDFDYPPVMQFIGSSFCFGLFPEPGRN